MGDPLAGKVASLASTPAVTVMMSFNTTGMGRGYVGADGKPAIMFTANDTK